VRSWDESSRSRTTRGLGVRDGLTHVASRRPPAPLRSFHPVVRRWFADTLGAPSAPQEAGWPAIASGENAL